jgi:hypothetical protein
MLFNIAMSLFCAFVEYFEFHSIAKFRKHNFKERERERERERESERARERENLQNLKLYELNAFSLELTPYKSISVFLVKFL